MSRASDPITEAVIGAAITVHRALGPGLLRETYLACLAEELRIRALHFERDVQLPLVYQALRVEDALRVDLMVERAVVVAVLAVVDLLPVHQAEVITQLRLSGLRTGLLLNFHVPILSRGVRRVVDEGGRPREAGHASGP